MTTGFGERLRQLRQERGLRQEDLVKAIPGLSPNRICRLECGKSEPSWPLVLQLAKVLDVGVEQFALPVRCRRFRIRRAPASLPLTGDVAREEAPEVLALPPWRQAGSTNRM